MAAGGEARPLLLRTAALLCGQDELQHGTGTARGRGGISTKETGREKTAGDGRPPEVREWRCEARPRQRPRPREEEAARAVVRQPAVPGPLGQASRVSLQRRSGGRGGRRHGGDYRRREAAGVVPGEGLPEDQLLALPGHRQGAPLLPALFRGEVLLQPVSGRGPLLLPPVRVSPDGPDPGVQPQPLAAGLQARQLQTTRTAPAGEGEEQGTGGYCCAFDTFTLSYCQVYWATDINNLFHLPTPQTPWPKEQLQRRTVMSVFYLILLQTTGWVIHETLVT